MLTGLCLRAAAQIEAFGEYAVSLGAGSYAQQTASGLHLGSTIHIIAGLQYGALSVNAGLGIILFPGQASDLFHTRLAAVNIDLPAGAAVRFLLPKFILAVGADVSGLAGDRELMIGPHIDFLFARKGYKKGIYRGIFVKALTDLRQRDHSSTPQYFGIGFKTTMG